MHPLFAQLLRRRPAAPFLAANPVAATADTQPSSGIVVSMSRPPRRADSAWPESAITTVDIMLDDLPSDPLRPLHCCGTQAGPAACSQDGVRLRIDPKDHRRVRISGNMREVCAALDALIAVQ